MDYVGAITVLVLTPVLWILTHKHFRFIYFGNIGNAILKEILECFFISILLVSLLGGVLKTVLSGVGTFLSFLLKAALIAAGIAAAIFLIAKVVKAVSSKKSSRSDSGDCSSRNPAEQPCVEAPESDPPCKDTASAGNDVEICAYIRENFTSSDYLQAIKYYRERTGADLEAAKAAVDPILK